MGRWLTRQVYFDLDAEVKQWQHPGSKIELGNCAPRLLSIRDCILVVPGQLLTLLPVHAWLIVVGQYDPMIKLDDQAFIDGFDHIVEIVSSKQFPRKLVIRSYDKDFTFLLKGKYPRLPPHCSEFSRDN